MALRLVQLRESLVSDILCEMRMEYCPCPLSDKNTIQSCTGLVQRFFQMDIYASCMHDENDADPKLQVDVIQQFSRNFRQNLMRLLTIGL